MELIFVYVIRVLIYSFAFISIAKDWENFQVSKPIRKNAVTKGRNINSGIKMTS